MLSFTNSSLGKLLFWGSLLASSLFATVNANQWVTEANAALFYCGGGSTQGSKAQVWARKARTESPYVSIPGLGYDRLKTIIDIAATTSLAANQESSRLFAAGARGIVRLYEGCLNADGAANGVWKTIEEPELERNQAVTRLHLVDPGSGVEYVLWTRGANGAIVKTTNIPTGTTIVDHPQAPPMWDGSLGTPPAGSPGAATPVGTGPVYNSPLPKAPLSPGRVQQQQQARPVTPSNQRIPAAVAQNRPVTPPVAQNRPVTPPVAQNRPVTPPVAQNRPVTPPVAQNRPVTPPVAQNRPVLAQGQRGSVGAVPQVRGATPPTGPRRRWLRRRALLRKL